MLYIFSVSDDTASETEKCPTAANNESVQESSTTVKVYTFFFYFSCHFQLCMVCALLTQEKSSNSNKRQRVCFNILILFGKTAENQVLDYFTLVLSNVENTCTDFRL